MGDGEREDVGTRQRAALAWRRLLPLALLILAAAVAFASGLHELLGFDALQQHHRALRDAVEARPMLVASGYVMVYFAAAATALPVAVFLTIVGGYLFGVWLGGALAVSAATVGAVAVFLAAGTSLGRDLGASTSPLVHRLRAGFQADEWSYLLVLRLLPLLPFTLVNVLPALLGVRLRVFVVTTFFGMLPGSFVYAGIGNGLGSIIARGDTLKLGTILEPAILAPLGGLAVLALLPMVVRRLQARREQQRPLR